MKQREIKKLAKKISIDRTAIDQERILSDAETALRNSQRPKISQFRVLLWKRLPLMVWAGGFAAALLVISPWVACFVLSEEVNGLRHKLELAQRDAVIDRTDDSTAINFFLKEHQDIVARSASLNPIEPQPLRIHVNQQDVLYYEMLDGQPEYMRPGVIVRGPSSQHQIDSSEAPTISNGHTLTLSEARQTTDFDLVSPSWLDPCYRLDQIRKIEGRDALQLLYTNGINSVSLFEQPLDGRRGLEPKDFREYAIYSSEGQAGGTILTWKDDSLSYVLICNTELSKLMDLAQSISAAK
jgi:hypothetical protein